MLDFFLKTIKYEIFSNVFYAVCLTSCVQVEENGVKNKVEKVETTVEISNRIKFKGFNGSHGYYFMIIEVDGKEYLTQNEGGIIELKK